jgi:hypothetical protein
MFSLSKNSSQSIGNRLTEEIALLERALKNLYILKTLFFGVDWKEVPTIKTRKRIPCGVCLCVTIKLQDTEELKCNSDK